MEMGSRDLYGNDGERDEMRKMTMMMRWNDQHGCMDGLYRIERGSILSNHEMMSKGEDSLEQVYKGMIEQRLLG